MTSLCRTCIWWKEDVSQPLKRRLGPVFGECRRQSPRVQLSRHSDDAASIWPPTEAGDWCGEHTPDLQSKLALETPECATS